MPIDVTPVSSKRPRIEWSTLNLFSVFLCLNLSASSCKKFGSLLLSVALIALSNVCHCFLPSEGLVECVALVVSFTHRLNCVSIDINHFGHLTTCLVRWNSTTYSRTKLAMILVWGILTGRTKNRKTIPSKPCNSIYPSLLLFHSECLNEHIACWNRKLVTIKIVWEKFTPN